MKRFTLMVCLAAALTACKKDAPTDKPDNTDPQPCNLTVIGSTSADGATKTQHHESGTHLSLSWNANDDRIGLYILAEDAPHAANIQYKADKSEAKTTFSAVETAAYWKDRFVQHDFYAYYPYDGEAGQSHSRIAVSVPAEQTQSAAGDMGHLSELDLLYAKKENISASADGSIELQFVHMFSVLELTLNSDKGSVTTDRIIFRCQNTDEVVSAEGAEIDLSTGRIDYSSAVSTNQISVKLASPVTLTPDSEEKVYMQITPGHGGRKFDILAVVNGQEQLLGTKGIPAAGIPAGVRAKLAMSVQSGPVNLSANGTANCYVVNKPGQLYCFDATVRGNGKSTEGIVATPVNGTKAFIYWTTVPVYSDPTVDINSDATRGLGCDATMNKTIVRNSVKLEDGKVYFSTNDDMSDGNVSIAVADDDNNILWSWHIWAVKDFDLDASGIEIDHPAVKGVTMLDRNLGAFSNGSLQTWADESNSMGLYYQWGRKDPLPGCRAVNGYHYYYYWYDAKTGTDMYKQGTGLASVPKYPAAKFQNWEEAVAYSIANPIFHIVPYSDVVVGGTAPDKVSYTVKNSQIWPYTWFKSGLTEPKDGWGALWGNPAGGVEVGSGSKSIYDPCPVGWRVPEPEAFRFITADGEDLLEDSVAKYTWKVNCSEAVSVTNGKGVIDASESQGFHFYVKGAKSLGEGGEIVLPEDRTTIYFPGAGAVKYMGEPVNSAFTIAKPTNLWNQIATNAPNVEYKKNETTGEMGVLNVGAYRVSLSGIGILRTNNNGIHWNQAASATSVRCVKE